MGTTRLDRLESLFRAALLHPPEERAAFLDAACVDEPSLRREVEDFLRADAVAEAEAFLDSPAPELAAVLFGTVPSRERDLLQRSVGPYRVLRRLGKGGMGDVYLAVREHPFKRHVALKLVRQAIDSEETRLRFAMERQILASLNHPNIARLLDGGVTEDGLPYLAMEYVEGLPITRYCDEHRLRLADRLRLFRTVCEAVHYAHQNLVIHRDLKPSNILVSEGGAVKLLDFGVAKLLNPDLSPAAPPVTRTELRMMTPEYASPEQVRGEPLTTTSDVYALGVILYELLTGQRPYQLAGRSTQEVMQVICDQDPERPSTKVGRAGKPAPPQGGKQPLAVVDVRATRDVSVERLQRQLRGDLDNIAMMALRKEPTRRYSSPEQLGQDLQRYLAGLPVAARPNTVGYRFGKLLARHRAVAVAVFLVLVSLVAGAAVALWQAGEARRAQDRAEQALAQSEAVTAFLMRLFEANDPAQRKGAEVTARELLERGVRRAEELQAQPLIQAQTLDVVGRVYRSLGQYDPARQLLERALLLRRTHLGNEHPLVAENMVHLARVLTDRGDYGRAESLLREALALQRRLLPEPHADGANTLMALGHLLPYRGRWEEAESTYREALALRRELLGAEHPLVAGTIIRLASVLRAQGRYEEAEQLFREALAMNQRVLGGVHADVASSMFQLSILLRHQGAYDEAESLLRRAVAIRLELDGGDTDPEVSSLLFELGDVLHLKGEDDEADTTLRRALTLRQQVMGDHPATADGHRFMGAFLHDTGALAAADSFYREALAIYRKQLGREHMEVAVTLAALGRLEVDWGRFPEAESYLRRALVLHRTSGGADHHHVGETLADLARLEARRGKPEQADSLYAEAVSILLKSQSEAHVTVQQIYAEVARFYEAWGRPELAAPYRAKLR